METRLKLAIQKSGKLSNDSLALLGNSGVGLDYNSGQLKSHAVDFPLDVFFLRDDDIPEYVEKGFIDVGIVGRNVVLEKSKNVKIISRLGFGRCRLSIAIPDDLVYEGIEDLSGKRIATSYPYVLSEYLKKNNITSEIHTLSGSVEVAPCIGLADIICDLVSSGKTLAMNGLKEVETILDSEAVLISNKFLSEKIETILDRFLSRVLIDQEASIF